MKLSLSIASFIVGTGLVGCMAATDEDLEDLWKATRFGQEAAKATCKPAREILAARCCSNETALTS
jgi:hypothetical protein